MPPVKNQKFSKPKNTKRTIKRLLAYIGKYKLAFLFVFLGIAISSIVSIVNTYFVSILIDKFIAPYVADHNWAGVVRELTNALLIVGSIYLAGVISVYIYNRLMVHISCGILNKIRDDMFTHMQTLPISYFDAHTHGELMSRYTNDVDTLREVMSFSLPQLVMSLINIVGVFVMMLVLSPILTAAIVVMIAIMLVIIKVFTSKSGKNFKRQQKAIGDVNGYIEEMIDGQRVVKVFCHESAVKDRFAELNEELRDSSCAANTYANILMPIMGNLSHVTYAVLAIVGSVLTISGIGGITIGVLVSFLMAIRQLANPITQVSQQTNAILSGLAGAERIFDMMDVKSETDEGYVELVNAVVNPDGSISESPVKTDVWAWKHPHGDGSVTYTRLEGKVELENVTFGYVPEKTVLKNLSLYAKPGQKIAFVGSTGAGKTTITSLINRFYEIQDGKIRYDGINITKIKKADLRRSLGAVLQDTHLFTGTVRENVRYGRLEATDEEVERACKIANADGFIRHLPDGYDTMLTADGANLSQGQRQLLSIARAAVADPPVLVLDEATSSIDTRTEHLIEKGMDELMRGRTVFVIAHRLSTVRNADAIMVLENGEIIERGNHDQLIEEKGRYYQLYTGMFELS